MANGSKTDQRTPLPSARSAEDWARELDCTPAQAREALDNLIAKGLTAEVKDLFNE